MVKKNNLIEEIKEIVQQIKDNYQEGVDFKIPYWSLKGGSGQAGAIHHLSPRLKSFLRKKFDFPVGVNDYLDYSKTDFSGNNYYYRLDGEHGEGEFEGFYVRYSNKGLKEEQPKNCAVCGKLTFEENGRIWLWNKMTVGKDFGQDSKVIGYFCPGCAEKYFANKEQPNQNEVSRLKEKLLRNLDKICFGPIGWLANAEVVKGEIEKDFFKGNPKWKEIETKIHKVEIEGEEINLTHLEGKIKKEIRQALIQEIKQNPPDWKIEKSTIYDLPIQNIPDSFRILKHESGSRHWNIGIIYLNKSLEKGKQDWAEIETLINSSPLPVIPNNKPKNISTELTSTEKENIQKYMEKQGITSLFLVGNQLIVEYKNKPSQRLIINNSELQNIQKCLEKTTDKFLSWEQVSGNSDSTNQSKFPDYTPLVLGLGGVIALGILVAYLFRKKGSKK